MWQERRNGEKYPFSLKCCFSHKMLLFSSFLLSRAFVTGVQFILWKHLSPLCWKSNNPSAQAPWWNYLPYESIAKSKCFWQNRSDLWKNTEKWNLSFFLEDLCHQIFHSSNSNICARGKIWWRKSLIKNDKVHFSVFFH